MATAIYTDDGQEHTVDVLDPATRAAQAGTYYVAWGHDGTAAAVTDSALALESTDESRVATTISQPAANQIQYVGEITAAVDHIDPATNNGGIEEAGIFDAATTGTMILRGTHPVINIETGDRVEYTFTLTFKDVSE